MTWFIYSILALVLFTGYDLLGRKLAVNSLNPRAFVVIYNLLVAILSPLLLFIEPINLKPISLAVVLLTIIVLVIWALFARFEYIARKEVEASTMSIVIRLAPALAFIFSILLLKETATLNKALGLILILIANYWLIIKTEGGFRLSQGIKYAILCSLALSLGWTLDKVVASYYGIMIYTLFNFSGASFFNLVVPPMSLKILKKEHQNTPLFKIFLLAMLNLLGYGFLIKALILGEVSKVTPIASATTPFVVILGILLLKETSHIKIKLLTAFITLIGIYLLR